MELERSAYPDTEDLSGTSDITQMSVYDTESPEIVKIKMRDDAYLFQYPKRAGNTTPLFRVVGTDYWFSLGPKDELGPTIMLLLHSVAIWFAAWITLEKTGLWVFSLIDLFFTANVILIAYGDPGRRTNHIPLSEFLRDRGNYKCETCLTKFGTAYSHCSKCDYCTMYLDHHCSILGNCVGRRTLWAFYLLLPTGILYLFGSAAVYFQLVIN